MSRLVLDYTNMLTTALSGRGVAEDFVDAQTRRFGEVHADIDARRAERELGFFDLPYASQVVAEIQQFADTIGQANRTVVVLGIGGSALGTLALQQALCKPRWNELDDEQRDQYPRLYVLDNVDPATIAPLLDRIDLRTTLFNVVSKSGTTAETMAQFLIVREKLAQVFPDDGYRRHLIFTTDPGKGVLRQLADAEDIATLPIPENVGGRFSVLSAVGLLPAALIGIDIKNLLQEWTQANGLGTPEYNTTQTGGPAHMRHFASKVLLQSKERGAGAGASKKEAECRAAEEALNVLQNSGEAI